MCLILWLQTNIKPECNYLWCRTHELGEINPTPFVPFSPWPLQDVASVGCLGTFHSSEQGLSTPLICSYTFLCRGNPFRGEGPRGIPSGRAGSGAVAVPAAVHPCAVGRLRELGTGRSAVRESLPGRRGRRGDFPKRGTANTLVEFLGQQVWRPIWSAGVFTRLENKPEWNEWWPLCNLWRMELRFCWVSWLWVGGNNFAEKRSL